eukprot:7456802-Pyramimonas_sp.AAC.2
MRRTSLVEQLELVVRLTQVNPLHTAETSQSGRWYERGRERSARKHPSVRSTPGPRNQPQDRCHREPRKGKSHEPGQASVRHRLRRWNTPVGQ